MTGPQMWRVAWSAAAVVLVGCAGTDSSGATANATPSYVQQYANAGSALDTATTTWDQLGQALVAAGTNTVANEAPIDAAYATALKAFSQALLAIQFPDTAENDVHLLAAAAGAVHDDLAGVASGAVSTTQFVSDESNLQGAINVVQQELGLGSSTPIAGA
jgi:predicted ATPase